MVQKNVRIFSAFVLVAFTSCLMPVTNTDDNILVTYEMDTIGSVGGSFIRAVESKDALLPDAGSVVKVADTLKQPKDFISWNKGYPPQQVVDFAKTLKGTPYLYGSTNPSNGFDCSGFITYVFNHFNFKVPRSSVEFTNRGREIPVAQARPGDLILFTGTDSSTRVVGHMGIVIENDATGELQFIHSSSGKANGVTISPLKGYYEGRFMKIISVKDGI